MLRKTLKLNTEEKKAIWIVALIAFFAQFPAFLDTHSSADDTIYIAHRVNMGWSYFYSGRYLAGILDHIIHIFGLKWLAMPQFSLVVGNCFIIASGILVQRLFRVKLTYLQFSLFLLILILHPYWAGISFFRVAFPHISISCFLAIYGIYYIRDSKKFQKPISLIIAIIFLVGSISLYQIPIGLALLLCFFGILKNINSFQYSSWVNFFRSFRKSSFFYQICACILSIIIYIIIVKLYINATNFKPLQHRSSFIDLTQIPNRIDYVMQVYKQMFYGHEPLLHTNMKILLNVILFLFLFQLIPTIYYIRRKFSLFQNISFAVFFLLIVCGLILSILGVNLIIKEQSTPPNKLIPFIFFYPIIFLFISRGVFYIKSKFFQRIFTITSLVIVFFFVGWRNIASSSAMLIRRRDFGMVHRVISHLEKYPTFYSTMPIAVFRNTWKTVYHHHYIPPVPPLFSYFASLGGRREVVWNWYSGYSFKRANKEELKIGFDYCNDPKEKKYVTIKKGVAIVCIWKDSKTEYPSDHEFFDVFYGE